MVIVVVADRGAATLPVQLLNSHPEFGEAVIVTTAPGAYRCEPTGGEVPPLPLVLITSVLPEVISEKCALTVLLESIVTVVIGEVVEATSPDHLSNLDPGFGDAEMSTTMPPG